MAGIQALLHVEAVSWLDLSTLAAIPEHIATIARCLECDRLCAIELPFIPVHLSERKNLACEEPLRLFSVLYTNPKWRRDILPRIRLKEIYTAARVKHHFSFV
jgi:hypothetical protein